MISFQAEQIDALTSSGWAACPSVADAVVHAGLPAVTANYLRTAFSAAQWHAAEQAVAALGDRFRSARFAEEVIYGIVLVPDPDLLDTRGPMDPCVRRDQLATATPDVVDERLAAGAARHRDRLCPRRACHRHPLAIAGRLLVGLPGHEISEQLDDLLLPGSGLAEPAAHLLPRHGHDHRLGVENDKICHFRHQGGDQAAGPFHIGRSASASLTREPVRNTAPA